VRTAALALLAFALAGCASASGPPQGAGSGAGARVEGVAVTAAIVPLANASVALVPGGQTAVTDGEGRFAFDGVPDGEYLVTAARGGYLAAQAGVRVAGGAPSPALVQLVLDSDCGVAPYFEAYAYEGLLDVSARFGPAGASGGGLFGPASLGTGYNLGPRLPDWVQGELVWSATQPLADSLLLTISPQNGSTLQTVAQLVDGPSPLALGFGRDVLEGWDMQPGQPLGLSAFAGNNTPPPGPALGVAAQQPFHLFTHLFYGYAPPAGWRFTADGDALPPG
jgi:hypothetical protein